MSWTSLWFISACLSASLGNRHAQPSVTNKHDFMNFPMDLHAESASAAVQKYNSPKIKLDDDKKTLSQQVADGKYGLIQKELFTSPASRPGVLSYDANSEVPKDNPKNFGGLNKSDIWLAENHLLVLKGGVYPILEALPEYSKPEWPPIDDFDAPRRQVKLPKHPKVPPPFPVQLTDGGPLQILGTNFTRTLNDSLYTPPYAIPPVDGYDPGSGPVFPPTHPHPANATPGKATLPTPSYPPATHEGKPGDGPPAQFPFPINGGLPPFFDSLPPGSAILPPPHNTTDQDDEDDLSIYYPPPYSFYYPKDNTTAVPPGPLVPGIVLPPPPDFFSLLTKPSLSTAKTTSTTETPRPVYLPRITSKSRKPTNDKTRIPNSKPNTESGEQQRNKSVNATVLKPTKPTRKPSPVYIYGNDIPKQPFEKYGPPLLTQDRSKISITTTKVPLRAYFATSIKNEVNIATRLPEKEQYTTKSMLQRQRSKPITQIYYYDDTALTPYPLQRTNQEKNENYRKYPEHIIEIQQKPLHPRYYYLPSKPYVTQRPSNKVIQPNSFKAHILKLQEQLQAYQKPPPAQYQQQIYNFQDNPEVSTPRSIYQYNFEVTNYRDQHKKLQSPTDQHQSNRQTKFKNFSNYNVQIEPAVEITSTESPLYQNPRVPVYYNEDVSSNIGGAKYTNNAPQYNYQDSQKYMSVVTPHNGNTYSVTPNPLYQTYYTKQDEQLFDDITKKYFTTFGKKLTTSTTPIPTASVISINSNHKQIIYTSAKTNNGLQSNRGSILVPEVKGKILLNYIGQNPEYNLHPQYVQVKQVPYPPATKPIAQFAHPLRPQVFLQKSNNFGQLQSYRNKVPQNNLNIQTIPAISIPSRQRPLEGKSGSFISYELPGDDAHFYFLTPQLTRKDDSDLTYYYTQPSNSQTR